MPLWQWIVDGVGVALALVLLFGLSLVLRRRWIARDGGTFELSHRARPAPQERRWAGRGWVLGLGRYTGDRLEFFRIFSLAPRPRVVLARSDLRYAGQRTPSDPESHVLYAGHVVVDCESPRGELELAMAPEAVTGFLAWLEAAPPGSPSQRR